MRRRNKAQVFLEYGFLIAIAAAALVVMYAYLSRSFQEKYRQTADVFGEGEQYAPGVTQAAELSTIRDIPALAAGRDPCPSVSAQANALGRAVYGYDVSDAWNSSGHLENITPNAALYQQHGIDVTNLGQPNRHFLGLLDRAANQEAQAGELRLQAQVLINSGFAEAVAQANQLIAQAQELENTAAGWRQEAQGNIDQMAQLQNTYPQCFAQ